MSISYGLPYKGSKNGISKWVLDQLPDADYFVDLFCGGGAITHCAILNNKYNHYIINDIEPGLPQLFFDAISGNISSDNFKRWYSRTEFNENITDPFVKFCWSFNSNGMRYLYSKAREPWFEAVFAARILEDFSKFEQMGINSDGSVNDIRQHQDEYRAKYIKWFLLKYTNYSGSLDDCILNIEASFENEKERLRLYLCNSLKKSGLTQVEVDRRLGNQMSGHYFGKSQWLFPTKEHYNKMRQFMPLDLPYEESNGVSSLLYRLKILKDLQEFKELETLDVVKRFNRIRNMNVNKPVELTVLNKDYSTVIIPENSVIYCDVPYFNTKCDSYAGFDHLRFYDWAEKQKNIYISEYSMPEDRFVAIAETEKIVLCTGHGSLKKAVEKIWIPKANL